MKPLDFKLEERKDRNGYSVWWLVKDGGAEWPADADMVALWQAYQQAQTRAAEAEPEKAVTRGKR